jgi:competence protein ComGA
MEHRFEELLETALYQKGTDIHFNITEDDVTVRLRGVNGLIPVETRGDESRLFNYLQYMANLDITCLNRPQSGAFSYFFQGQFYDFRFAVIQSTRQKNGVLRILNCHYGLTLDRLTDDKEIQDIFTGWLNKRSGLILFTGLTGSGKTTTLYSLLKLAKGKTIYSIEDPIEVVQDNIVQLEVNEKTGFGYDEGIRQILRHNPDIIMIGEIRDEKTARMCIRAALTGTLVMSSLHARNGCSAVNRLLDLGVKGQDLKDCAVGIVSQRLVRLKNGKGYRCEYDILHKQELSEALRGKLIYDERLQKKIDEGVKKGIYDERERSF